ncbi:MAG: hypothetical protein IJA35_04935 [Clostridia bacterium]|nr:hypothetical protein [Clostridia bacterium]
MNKQQKAYAAAKAAADALCETMKEKETRFIAEQGITNTDGTTPRFLYLIEDETTFDRVCEDYLRSPLCLDDEYNKARKALEKADAALSHWRAEYPADRYDFDDVRVLERSEA